MSLIHIDMKTEEHWKDRAKGAAKVGKDKKSLEEKQQFTKNSYVAKLAPKGKA